MRPECYLCYKKTVERLLAKIHTDETTANEFIASIRDLFDRNLETPMPLLALKFYRMVNRYFKGVNVYEEEKFYSNDILLRQYSYWKNFISNSNDSFKTAAKLAVIGNIIDYGAHTVEKDISGQIKSLTSRKLKIDRTYDFKNEIEKAVSILYLGDNAGEIVFDKLFIETIDHPGITYVVRGKPVINDVTLKDARQCEMEKVCRVISNGFDAPSTLLECCSDEFMDAYLNADLVISKGQGNFEGLMDVGEPRIFYMLMVKCKPIADLLGVEEGDLLITDMKFQYHAI
jgi:uncharacterized protein with ATP-grasp and redox domains